MTIYGTATIRTVIFIIITGLTGIHLTATIITPFTSAITTPFSTIPSGIGAIMDTIIRRTAITGPAIGTDLTMPTIITTATTDIAPTITAMSRQKKSPRGASS